MSQVRSEFAHSVTIGPASVRIDATETDTYRWSVRPGSAWPCATLPDVETFYVEFDECGMIDSDLPSEEDVWIDGAELSAYCADVLAPILPKDHPAYLVAVGQFS